MINDIDELNVVIEDTDSVTVNEGTPTDISEIMHNEEIRQENEAQRIENEEAREEYINDLKQRVLDGEFDGEDGFSPIANVVKTDNTSVITITDKVGTTTASVLDGTNGEDGISPTVTMEKQGKVTTLTITDATGTHTTEIRDGNDGSGTGDMLKATYDTNDNGVVDNAEKVNNHTVETDVPANAVFTDTTYTAGTGIDITNNVISSTQSSAEWGNITGILADQEDLMEVLNLKLDNFLQTTLRGNDENNPIILDGLTPGTYPLWSTSDKVYIKLNSSTDLRYYQTGFNDTGVFIVVPKTIDSSTLEDGDRVHYVLRKILDPSGNLFLEIDDVVYDSTYNGKLKSAHNYPFYLCTLPDISTKQDIIDSSHKLSADLVDDTSTTNKFFSGNYNDLTNKPTIPDELADLSDDSTHRLVTDTEKTTWNSKQNAIDSSHKLSADNVDDTSTTNKFVTASDKTTWSGKQDALVSGTNIKTINSTSLLGSGNIEVGADIPQQDTAPSNPSEDDLWIDTDDNTNLVEIDSQVSTTSTNPIENQAITNYVNEKMNYEIGEKQIGYLDDNGIKTPLYRAIIKFGATSTNPYKPDISALNIGELINVSGSYKTGATDRVPITVWYSATYNLATTVKLNTQTVDIAWAGWGSLSGGYIILEYTKTS